MQMMRKNRKNRCENAKNARKNAEIAYKNAENSAFLAKKGKEGEGEDKGENRRGKKRIKGGIHS